MLKLKTKHVIDQVLNTGLDLSHPDQCGNVDHLSYKCEVKLYSPEELNARGFVIDHSTIRSIIKEEFAQQISSCETMAMKIGSKLHHRLVLEEVEYYRIHVKIKPIGGDKYQFGSVTYIKTKAQR